MMYWCSHYTMIITYDNGGWNIQTLAKMDYDVWGYALGCFDEVVVAQVIYN